MEHTNKMGPKRRRLPLVRVATMAMGLFTVSALLLSPGTAHATSSHATAGVIVSTAKNPQFGTILVSGRALYTLKPSSTACGSKCLKIWPAVMLPKGATKAIAGSGVNGAKLGTVKRARGARQVTYGGKALYRFYKDGAGQVKGNLTDTWGKWSVVVTKKVVSGAGTTTTSPAGGGIGF